MPVFIIGVMFLFVFGGNSFAGQWSLNAGMQAFSGNYIYTQNTSVYYLSGGIRYRTPGWNISLSVPFIAQNSSSVTNMGGMFFPNNENQMHGDETHWNMHGRETSETLTTHHMSFALADIYAYGEKQVFAENGTLPSFSLVGQVKFPTASVEENYGTGKCDYSVGAALRKSVYPFVLSFDLSYFRIGDPAGITYRDPVFLGFGGAGWAGNCRELPGVSNRPAGDTGLLFRGTGKIVLKSIEFKALK